MEVKRSNEESGHHGMHAVRGNETAREQEKRINDEDNLDTREIASSVEEGDEDYDDEEAEKEEKHP